MTAHFKIATRRNLHAWRRRATILLFVVLIASTNLSRKSAGKASQQSQAPQVVFTNPALIVIADAPVSNTPPGVGNPYPSTILVSGQGNGLVHLQVTLNTVNHAFPDDIDVLLVGPAGQSFILQSDAGGNTAAVNRTFTFDDLAIGQMPNDGGIPTGTFKPTNHQGNDGSSDVFPSPAPVGPFGNPGPQSSGAATLDGVFGGTDPNGTWSLFVTDDENLDAGTINGGWSLSITSIVIEPPDRANVIDFDGDFKTDPTVVRATGATRTWYIYRSALGFLALGWGAPGDIVVPHDYDGDNRTDIAVWRPSDGNWYIFQSNTSTISVVNFGTNGDNPTVVDDYDGDGKADPAVVRNSGGLKTWYFLRSTTGFGFKQWGLSTDTVVPGDFDGDGKADLAVKRFDQPSPGLATFYVDRSATGFDTFAWGNNSDIVAPGDYDGDNKTDIAVTHQVGTDLFWYVRLSGGGFIENLRWGLNTDNVTQGDYDGDGKTDVSVWRSTDGVFYTHGSAGANIFFQWGQAGDFPAANYNTH